MGFFFRTLIYSRSENLYYGIFGGSMMTGGAVGALIGALAGALIAASLAAGLLAVSTRQCVAEQAKLHLSDPEALARLRQYRGSRTPTT